MSATPTLFHGYSTALEPPARARRRTRKRPDLGLLMGLGGAVAAAVAAASWTGAGTSYFLQPRGAAMVLGGTLGVLILTTPVRALGRAIRRVVCLFLTQEANAEALVEEVLRYSRLCRFKGLAGLEEMIPETGDGFLREGLALALEVDNRAQLLEVLENRIRTRERQGEADARTLEVAGSFAPTLGILGTVIGLIDVLRDFSDLGAVGMGIGMAFVSTIYGLGLANLLLLPAAHRIRARVAEAAEHEELALEGVLCLYDQSHPALAAQRLRAYLNRPARRKENRRTASHEMETQTA